MKFKKQNVQEQKEEIDLDEQQIEEKKSFLEKNKKTLKDLIAPAGIDASKLNHLEINNKQNKICQKHGSGNNTKNVYLPRIFEGDVYFWRY